MATRKGLTRTLGPLALGTPPWTVRPSGVAPRAAPGPCYWNSASTGDPLELWDHSCLVQHCGRSAPPGWRLGPPPGPATGTRQALEILGIWDHSCLAHYRGRFVSRGSRLGRPGALQLELGNHRDDTLNLEPLLVGTLQWTVHPSEVAARAAPGPCYCDLASPGDDTSRPRTHQSPDNQ